MANGVVFTTVGKKVMLNRYAKATPDYTAPSSGQVGTGTATPAITDTALGTSVAAQAVTTGYPLVDEINLQLTYQVIIDTLTANGSSITEYGLFNTDGSPAMVCRTVFPAITKTSNVQIIFTQIDKITI